MNHFIFLLISCIAELVEAPFPHELPKEDAIRIAEATRIAEMYGDSIWPGLSETPFAILLVTQEIEFLINHPNPSKDFQLLGYDPVVKGEIYSRQRQYSTGLLATFPAVNNLPTVVLGTPQNTGKSSLDWILTLLHEHFHQYQMGHSSYFQDVEELNLSNGDQTGMWMLNYQFPYKDPLINDLFSKYLKTIEVICHEGSLADPTKLISELRQTRQNLKEKLSIDDYTYMSFQIWQEGIAKYCEYKFLQYLQNYTFSTDYKTMEDSLIVPKYAVDWLRKECRMLTEIKLSDESRICFYYAGLAEGILLDRLKIGWRHQYLSKKFFLENYYQEK